MNAVSGGIIIAVRKRFNLNAWKRLKLKIIEYHHL